MMYIIVFLLLGVMFYSLFDIYRENFRRRD
jgi:hypothetical protein